MSAPLPDYVPEPDSFEDENAAMKYMAPKVRQFLRDEADKNHLLLGQEEFTWEDIYRGVEDALQDYNVTQPSTSHKLNDAPKAIRALIYYRAAAFCLKSAANQQARNNQQYSDQGFSLAESDKAPMYLQMASQLEQYYEEKKAKYKAEVNAANTWGGIYSESVFTPTGLDTYLDSL
jgi:hypothetical protein